LAFDKKSPKENTGGKLFILTRARLITIIMASSLLVYANTLFNGFVYDDRGTIVENKYITTTLENLPSFFTPSYFKIAELEATYRPVATFSYHVLYAIFKKDPFGYHLASLILHIINASLVYCLINILQKNRMTSLVAALLFACHPVLTEAVNCISFNEDLLATLFYLLSFIFYLRVNPEDNMFKKSHYALSLVFYLLGLLSKEMAITLPVIIMLYDSLIRQSQITNGFLQQIVQTLKHRIFFYLGYAALSLFYLWLNFVVIVKPAEAQQMSHGSLTERLLYLPHNIVMFIRLAIVPINLSADYGFSYPKDFFELHNVISVIVVAGVLLSSLAVYKKQKAVFFGIWWFFLTLFPVYNVIEIFNPIADRYLYLPLVGYCMVLAFVLTDLTDRIFVSFSRLGDSLKIGLIILLLAAYSTMTIARNKDWKDGLSLWSKTLQITPNSAVAHGNLGRAYLDEGLYDNAIVEFEATLKIRPQSYKAYYNLGLAYEKKGLFKEAIQQYEKTLNLKPGDSNARFNLGNIYKQQGLLDKAIIAYKDTIEIDPGDIEARNNLGVVHAMQGDLDKAIMEWETVLKIDPDNQNAIDNIKKAKEIIKKR